MTKVSENQCKCEWVNSHFSGIPTDGSTLPSPLTLQTSRQVDHLHLHQRHHHHHQQHFHHHSDVNHIAALWVSVHLRCRHREGTDIDHFEQGKHNIPSEAILTEKTQAIEVAVRKWRAENGGVLRGGFFESRAIFGYVSPCQLPCFNTLVIRSAGWVSHTTRCRF